MLKAHHSEIDSPVRLIGILIAFSPDTEIGELETGNDVRQRPYCKPCLNRLVLVLFRCMISCAVINSNRHASIAPRIITAHLLLIFLGHFSAEERDECHPKVCGIEKAVSLHEHRVLCPVEIYMFFEVEPWHMDHADFDERFCEECKVRQLDLAIRVFNPHRDGPVVIVCGVTYIFRILDGSDIERHVRIEPGKNFLCYPEISSFDGELAVPVPSSRSPVSPF